MEEVVAIISPQEAYESYVLSDESIKQFNSGLEYSIKNGLDYIMNSKALAKIIIGNKHCMRLFYNAGWWLGKDLTGDIIYKPVSKMSLADKISYYLWVR